MCTSLMDTTRVILDGLQTRWTWFVDNHSNNQLLIWVLIPYFCSLAANIIISVFGELLDRFSPQSYYNKYKILYKQERTQYPFWMLLKQSLISQVALFVASLAGLILFPLVIKPTDEIPSFFRIFLTMYSMSVVDDFWFYWNHRTLHNVKWLWENVHSFHHQIREPTGLATNYVHPLEMILVSVGPFIGALLFRPTLFVLYLYIFIRTGIDIAHHTGWEFPFSPLRILPFHTQTKFHDTHHYISGYCGNAKNLATTSTIWDRVFGTYSSNESLFVKKG